MSASVSLSLSPELVVCARCSCVMLSPGFLIPSPLHCPTAPLQGCGNPQRPVDAGSLMRWPQCTLCPWRWLGCGQAGGGAARGPVSVCARWRSMLRSGTCPPILPHVLSPPSKAHGCVFFFLFFLAFSSVFSLALPLSFLLSLSFSVFFFFLFFFQKIKARKGEGSKEKAQERPVQTTQLVRLCPLLVDSLPSLSPTSPPACCSLKITPSPPVTGGLQVLQGQCWRWHRSGTKGVSGKVALACSTLSNLHW